MHRGLEDITGYFQNASSTTAQQQDGKLDDHLQPIPAEVHGAVVRTDPEQLQHYELLGKK